MAMLSVVSEAVPDLTVQSFLAAIRRTAFEVVMDHLPEVKELRARGHSLSRIAEFLTKKTGTHVLGTHVRRGINSVEATEAIETEVERINRVLVIRRRILMDAGFLPPDKLAVVKDIRPKEIQAVIGNGNESSVEAPVVALHREPGDAPPPHQFDAIAEEQQLTRGQVAKKIDMAEKQMRAWLSARQLFLRMDPTTKQHDPLPHILPWMIPYLDVELYNSFLSEHTKCIDNN